MPRRVRYPARQTLAASQAVARLNQVNPSQVIFAQQNPQVIDQGVFHNDVIAVSNRQVLFCHEQAFAHQEKLLATAARTRAGLYADSGAHAGRSACRMRLKRICSTASC